LKRIYDEDIDGAWHDSWIDSSFISIKIFIVDDCDRR